jgi:hypothetical protein
MSGGSNDDATLAIAHRENGKAVLDVAINQGQKPKFNPRKAIERFAKVLKEYRCFSVMGDAYAGETFPSDFRENGIRFLHSELTTSELYESLEPPLNAGEVVLLDVPDLENQLLGLVWRNNKIDHLPAEHDDFATSAAGALYRASKRTLSSKGLLVVERSPLPSLWDARQPASPRDEKHRSPLEQYLDGDRQMYWDD